MINNDIYNLKVLYIEDESDTLDAMARFLRRRFASVTIAKDGEEGWRKFNECHPDLIITDLLMPEYSGFDLIRKIRDTGYANPIMITSALQDVDSIIKTVDLGISKYIIKPISLPDLDSDLDRIGQEIIAQQNKIFDYTIEQKKERETSIRHSISNMLKKYSGKGPRDVKVFIGSDLIEITCLEVRTVFEETLYEKGKNTALIEQNRRLYYQILKNEIEQNVSHVVEMQVKIKDIHINAAMDSDVINLVCS